MVVLAEVSKTMLGLQTMPVKLDKQGGIALVTVLMVFVVAALLASQILFEHTSSLTLAVAQRERAQIEEYLLAGEAQARQTLKQDFSSDSEFFWDDLSDNWTRPDTIVFADGAIDVRVMDIQRGININDLVETEHIEDIAPLADWLNVNNTDSVLLGELVDWFDEDLFPQGLHGEDQSYLSRELPYRAANRTMAHVSELNWIYSADRELVQALSQVIFTLPPDTAVNVNTADAFRLRRVAPLATDQQISAIVRARESQPFRDIQEFLEDPTVAGLTLHEDKIRVYSEFFRVQVTAKFLNKQGWLVSLLHRNPQTGEIKTIFRDYSQRFSEV